MKSVRGAAGAGGDRRLDMLALPHREHLGAHQPGIDGPPDDDHGDRRVAAGPGRARRSTAMASRIGGKDSVTSTSRMMAASTRPPTKPAIAPSVSADRRPRKDDHRDGDRQANGGRRGGCATARRGRARRCRANARRSAAAGACPRSCHGVVRRPPAATVSATTTQKRDDARADDHRQRSASRGRRERGAAGGAIGHDVRTAHLNRMRGSTNA